MSIYQIAVSSGKVMINYGILTNLPANLGILTIYAQFYNPIGGEFSLDCKLDNTYVTIGPSNSQTDHGGIYWYRPGNIEERSSIYNFTVDTTGHSALKFRLSANVNSISTTNTWVRLLFSYPQPCLYEEKIITAQTANTFLNYLNITNQQTATAGNLLTLTNGPYQQIGNHANINHPFSTPNPLQSDFQTVAQLCEFRQSYTSGNYASWDSTSSSDF